MRLDACDACRRIPSGACYERMTEFVRDAVDKILTLESIIVLLQTTVEQLQAETQQLRKGR